MKDPERVDRELNSGKSGIFPRLAEARYPNELVGLTILTILTEARTQHLVYDVAVRGESREDELQ